MLLVTDDLARRLEMAEAIDAAGCAEAQCNILRDCGSEVRAIAGGVAVYCGLDSPLTHAIGLGLHGPVTVEDMEELEHFYQHRGAPVIVDLCPHADPSLWELLSSRGYRIVEFTNVMARSLQPDEPPPSAESVVEVRKVEPHEEDLYVSTVVGGFFGRQDLSESELRLGSTLFHMPCGASYLAFVEGQPAGGGGISIRNRVASLYGDATNPSFRGRGVHSALIRERVAIAQESGCDLVTAGTTPGSNSQRNYQKLDFQVAYTKVTLMLD